MGVMPFSHLLLALAVVAVWGTNFVVIKLGLAELPPFLFAVLRFALSAFPFLLFVRKPAVAWWRLAAFGVLLGAGQFGLLFLAMRADISPGLASLVIQTQVFFTIALVALTTGERFKPLQFGALALAVAGMGVIALNLEASVTAWGLALVLAAALCWALGNLVVRGAGRGVDMLGFMVWSSVFAVPPLLLMSLVFDGWPAMRDGVLHASTGTWLAVAWQAVGNTLFGYGAWGWLLNRHPAATITPMALLVPVFGFSASAWWLGESLPAWKLGAAALVMTGLLLNLLAARTRAASSALPSVSR
ncbi:O-acetylserine/cysteine efflux transporter [Rivibacter subsaxonicus]|uniref:O-acetylserine/cysteine efflux transporter n=2 Tax=Rivibacter subsaxonicus TaxID=457575 RepID=A0A4Q7VWS0_9BURK|nr:O-acetylserine/cysteine efflux transporter [Rivibacter subsaxonicus]